MQATRAPLVFVTIFGLALASRETGDRTITKVVKALQDMLDKSKADGDSERDLFAKHKCYCDTNEAEKKASIEKYTRDIDILENDIEEIQASTGGLSEEVAQLRADMTANEQARAVAESLRAKENAAFVAEEADLTGAIGQMKEAIETLSEIGADQTLSVGADHKQFMAKNVDLLGLKTSVQHALVAASAVMSKKQVHVVESLLQAPFTATYTAQSVEVVGILKDMRDTFTANLASARAAEKSAAAAHAKFMANKEAAYAEMSSSFDNKQARLGGNDGDLATKKTQLSEAKSAKAADEAFLASLLEICAAKAKDYQKRKVLRANEEVALAEAIAILNSDAAFASFSKVSATKTGATGFVQLAAINAHAPGGSDRQQLVTRLLRGNKSVMLAKIASLLRAGNPFDAVLKEIAKMIALIDAEGKADAEQLSWCNDERTTNDANHAEKVAQIDALNSEITELTDAIENPETGLKAQIAVNEQDLVDNDRNQKEETAARTEANVAYQKDIANLVEAERILVKAIAVLKNYYSQFGASMLQRREDPAPPATWDNDSYKGQSEAATGAIGMLEFILGNTKKEETEAHDDEAYAQHAYEDSMAELKAEQATLEKALADLQETLAETQKTLMSKKEDLKSTEADKAAIEAYLLKIKPGCDFITTNFDLRQTNRATEKAAMENAITLIKGTPAYKTAVAEAHVESLGDCDETCEKHGEAHVECKACLAKVTIPGYCAGHADTEGC